MLKIPKSFTKVTPFTKLLALSMLIIFPIIGFLLGIQYNQAKNVAVTTPDELGQNIIQSKSSYDHGEPYFKKFTLTFPELCTANDSRINCDYSNVHFNLYLRPRPLELKTKQSQIKLGNYLWDKSDAGNLVTYGLTENSAYYLLQINYNPFSKAAGSMTEQILSTFKFTN